jgi:hypothetical protein
MKWILLVIPLVIISCSENEDIAEQQIFELKDKSIGISFENNLKYTENFNPYIYRNFFNGGGVAIGDINNDGLQDIYFTGNMVDNKLFLNKGHWKFEDITQKAGVACPNVWSSGATFVDINGDGLLDIYVCKAGEPGGPNRHNELFINNGDLTFAESSRDYGLDVEGLSVHAAFFDYDKDGDLDCYVLNNSMRSIGGFDLIRDQRIIPDSTGNSNKLFRNDRGKFKDVTSETGIYSSKIGFGLGITLGDFNNDDWTDIYISNDFFEKDYLYINDTTGKYKEQLEDYFGSISMGSMGADLADLNNDLLTDLMVTEMLPVTQERQKTKTVFESWDKHQMAIKQGYYNQYSRNTLQRNMGGGQYTELGRQAEVSASEWSWGALIFDMDNDGLRDIFVSNGIYKDLLDRDYLSYTANQEVIKNKLNSNEKDVITKLIDVMPSMPLPNAAFHNLGNFRFEDKSDLWGLSLPSYSNGSAYADLDNDGDLDLVVNNVGMASFVYENKTDTLSHRSISLNFRQEGLNQFAIGTKAIIKFEGDKFEYGENFSSRGFQSSVPPGIHFGVGDSKIIDSLWVKWPDGSTEIRTGLSTNKTYTIRRADGQPGKQWIRNTRKAILQEIPPLFNFVHKENDFIDFNNERLLTQMYSNEGPALATGDINNDGVSDVFIGGSKNQSGNLFISTDKRYTITSEPFTIDLESEDTDAVFFDGDNDGDLDLYVCHGGKAFSPYSINLHDAYYRNEDLTFVKSETSLHFPRAISSAVVSETDFDKDGDTDLFIGERFKTSLYGLPASGYILVNDGQGNFSILDNELLNNIGMITDAAWADINNDGWQDPLVVGEWMPIKIYINHQGHLEDASELFDLSQTSGLWSALELADVDGDGDKDIIAGNIGLNNFFEVEMKMFVSDYDKNGFQEQIVCKKLNDKYYPIVDKDELISQIPSLKKKLLYYHDYAKSDMYSIFTADELENALVFDLQVVESSIFFNENGRFIRKPLPDEIQYAPVYAITTSDINEDGQTDLFFGGNQYMVKPQFGRYDASAGWALFGPNLPDGITHDVHPLNIKGQIRALQWITLEREKILIASINGDKTTFHAYKN